MVKSWSLMHCRVCKEDGSFAGSTLRHVACSRPMRLCNPPCYSGLTQSLHIQQVKHHSLSKRLTFTSRSVIILLSYVLVASPAQRQTLSRHGLHPRFRLQCRFKTSTVGPTVS